MRILIITQYFWPENFKINDIALALSTDHAVTVVTAQPNYPSKSLFPSYKHWKFAKQIWQGTTIIRAPIVPRAENSKGIRLAFNYFSFAFTSSIRLLFLRQQFDAILVYEPSPITIGIPAYFAKKRFKAPVFFWVQDIWPQSLTAAGGITNKKILSVADKLTRWVYKHSDKLLVQSRGFIPYLLNQNVADEKIIYYPNTTELFYQPADPLPKYQQMLPKGFVIMFAGNIGEAQSFDTLLDTAALIKNDHPDIKWVILGNGRIKGDVQKRILELNLEESFILLGSYPSEEMPLFFACADALIVSLKKDPVFAVTIPSKVQSYLACGVPIIGSLDGEGAKIIREAQAGFTADSENVEELRDAILKLYTISPDERRRLGRNARNYYLQEFERNLLVKKLVTILENK